MADWKTYLKAAQNTAKKQAPGAREAIRRESQVYSKAAQKVWDEKGRAGVQRARESANTTAQRGKETANESMKTMRAAAKVAGKRYKQAGMTSRILAALRDTSIIALSLGAIWFVFSRVFPIPISWVLVALAVLVLLRVLHAITHNPYLETEADDPEGIPVDRLPEGATIKKR